MDEPGRGPAQSLGQRQQCDDRRHAEGDAASLMLFRARRGLPISAPKPLTRIGFLRWYFHRLIHRIPREQYLIAKAHQRGLQKGWALVHSQSQKSQ